MKEASMHEVAGALGNLCSEPMKEPLCSQSAQQKQSSLVVPKTNRLSRQSCMTGQSDNGTHTSKHYN